MEPRLPGQDLAVSLETAVLVQARQLVSLVLGSTGAMNKCGFFLELSSSRVALGIGADLKAP